MTEQEWKLSKQLAETQIALAQANMQLCQAHFTEAQAKLKALGDEYKPEATEAA